MENESFGDLFPPFQSTANDIHEKVRLPHNNSSNSPLVDKIAVHAQRHAAKKKKGLRNLQGTEKNPPLVPENPVSSVFPKIYHSSRCCTNVTVHPVMTRHHKSAQVPLKEWTN